MSQLEWGKCARGKVSRGKCPTLNRPWIDEVTSTLYDAVLLNLSTIHTHDICQRRRHFTAK